MTRIRFAGRTDIGKQRDHNEDAILVMEGYRTMVVADGLGGHSSGHIASSLCVSTLADFFSVTVDADATFGADVTCVGDVTISGEPRVIPDGATLTGTL